MMTGKDREVLRRIGLQVPKDLMSRLMVDRFDPEEEGARKLAEMSLENAKRIKNPKMRAEVMKKLMEDIKPSQISDPSVEKEISLFYEVKIKKAIKDGELSPVTKDAWMRSKGL